MYEKAVRSVRKARNKCASRSTRVRLSQKGTVGGWVWHAYQGEGEPENQRPGGWRRHGETGSGSRTIRREEGESGWCGRVVVGSDYDGERELSGQLGKRMNEMK